MLLAWQLRADCWDFTTVAIKLFFNSQYRQGNSNLILRIKKIEKSNHCHILCGPCVNMVISDKHCTHPQADTAFIMTYIWVTLVISLESFIHRQPKLTSRERIRLIISGVRAGTWLFNESGIGLHGGREFIKDLYGNPRHRFRKINTRRNSQ